MDAKYNMPRTECKAIVAVAAIIGRSSLGRGSRRQSIATVIKTAYDLGGREATSPLREGMRRGRSVSRHDRKAHERASVTSHRFAVKC